MKRIEKFIFNELNTRKIKYRGDAFVKKVGSIIIGLILLIGLVGCGQLKKESATEEKETGTTNEENIYLTFKDDTDAEVVLKEKPERIAVLSSDSLAMLYDLGGQAVGRLTSSSQIPEKAKDVPELGTANEINVEELVTLKPDLVIGTPTFHAKLAEVLESNGIPLALLKTASFEDVKEKAKLLGEIIGTEEKAEQLLQETESKMNEITAKIPAEDEKTVMILNVTPSSISIQKENTTALEIAELLGLNNIAEELDASPKSPSTAPYSMEKMVEKQPDFIFMTIHGAEGAGLKKIETDLKENPAWASLNAVKNNQAVVLPSQLFLVNPGFHYYESMNTMASIVYPELFKNEN